MSNLSDARDHLGSALTLALSGRSAALSAYQAAVIGNSKDTRLAAEQRLGAFEAIVTSIQAAQSSLAQVT